MGFVKEQQLKEQEQGWASSAASVCTECVDDDALEAAIQADEVADLECDFCSRSPAAPLDSLLDAFVSGLKNEFGTADNEGVAYDGREGGYQWTTIDTYDLVSQFWGVLTGEGLVEAIQGAMEDETWVERNFAWRRRDEVLNESWDLFCRHVKHEMRYVIWLRNEYDLDEARSTGEVPPALILEQVGELLERLGVGLRRLPAGYQLWRARTHVESDVPGRAEELGTPPRDKATQANRMSPAGIPMFYGSADRETAIREVAVRSSHSHVTAGIFELSREATVIDFGQFPRSPSMFDPHWGGDWRFLRFMNRFADQLSQPARETFEQVDYVPTQIVTEYLLRVFGGGDVVDGLIYKSALTGRECAVLDVASDRCVDQAASWMLGDELRLGLRLESVTSESLRHEG